MSAKRRHRCTELRLKPVEVAYLVLAHTANNQLLRLLSTMRRSSMRGAIFLHYDAKREPPAHRILNDLEVIKIEPRLAVNWGDATQIDVMLQSVEFITKHVEFEWLTILSGQDYPLRPLPKIEQDLISADYDAFVRAGLAGVYLPRYELQYLNLPTIGYAHLLPQRVRSLFARSRARLNQVQKLIRLEGGTRGTPARLGIRATRTPFNDDFKCMKGSQWMTLNRRAASYLLKFNREHPEVLKYYRNTVIPDESYLQTILCNNKSLRVKDDHRRFILWDEHRISHPVTLTLQHFDKVITSGKDFGRKFDMAVDPTILDALDRVVLSDVDRP